jgi:hypothetical protein
MKIVLESRTAQIYAAIFSLLWVGSPEPCLLLFLFRDALAWEQHFRRACHVSLFLIGSISLKSK